MCRRSFTVNNCVTGIQTLHTLTAPTVQGMTTRTRQTVPLCERDIRHEGGRMESRIGVQWAAVGGRTVCQGEGGGLVGRSLRGEGQGGGMGARWKAVERGCARARCWDGWEDSVWKMVGRLCGRWLKDSVWKMVGRQCVEDG